MIWNEEYETLPRETLESIQLKRLQSLITRVHATVPYYKKKMEDAGVTPGDIKTLKDLSMLPFTTKEDLRKNYPFGLFTVPMEQVVRVHASSGTTGQATVVGYTARDIRTWSELMTRALTAAGVHRGDMVQNAYGYGLFTGGLGAHYGTENLGATVIPISGGNTQRQIMIMRDFGSTVITCTPSYALNIAEVMAEQGVDPTSLPLRIGVLGAEPWSEEIRQEIEKKLDIKAMDIYGLSEVLGPGVASECIEEQNGLHIGEDHFLPEIIDPDTGEVKAQGETGELVFTSLTKEAFPVIRYRTRDISSLNYVPCTCGRTLARMSKIKGRTDDMLIIRGVNVFPLQVEKILMGVKGIEPHYQIIVNREGSLDTMEVQVEVSEKIFSDAVKSLENMSKQLREDIKNILGVSCRVKLVEPKTIMRSEGKAVRVIDNRKL